MTPRKQTTARRREDLDAVDELTANGRHATAGAELTVDGIRGRVRFVQHVRNTATGAEWLDVVTSRGFARSVRPDAVRTVHRTRRLGASA